MLIPLAESLVTSDAHQCSSSPPASGVEEVGLRDYWLSHAGNTMDDLYDMVKDNAAFRKQKAAEYGVGFELPASIAPVVSKKRAKTRRAKAA